MAQLYANHDVVLRNQAYLRIRDAGGEEGAAQFSDLGENNLIPFQFPPKIMSDNRKGEWSESNLPGAEPVATFKNSGPREFALVMTYIVDGYPWTTGKISQITHRLRGYFANTRNDTDRRNLVVDFKYIGFGNQEAITCYIRGIDVKHGDTLVLNPEEPSTSFPLRTDITLDMRVWVRSDNQDVKGLYENGLPPLWY